MLHSFSAHPTVKRQTCSCSWRAHCRRNLSLGPWGSRPFRIVWSPSPSAGPTICRRRGCAACRSVSHASLTTCSKSSWNGEEHFEVARTFTIFFLICQCIAINYVCRRFLCQGVPFSDYIIFGYVLIFLCCNITITQH